MAEFNSNRQLLTLDEIHVEELNLLLKFDLFCKDHGLRYSLAGGTLLGAVRHKGFIPWDDDVDVNMPRPDWDKLVSLRDDFTTESGLVIAPFFGADINGTPLIKVVNPNIFVQADAEQDSSYLWLDVFPVDGLPVSQKATDRIYKRARFIRKTLAVAVTTADSGHSGPRRLFKKALGPVLRAVNAQRFLNKALDAYARKIPFGSTSFVGGITWGLYGSGERVPLNGFENFEMLEFEGKRFSCMSCWDAYLSGLYGDYMQLPPVDMRVTHEMLAWRLDRR